MTSASPQTITAARTWRWRSIGLIALFWAVLQLGGLFTPGLLDDVDSVYIRIAREMLLRHDFVTPTIDGIRFFDKPPLMYWLAAGSMRVFGLHDWAARLPLALIVLTLLLAVYALGVRFFRSTWPEINPDRGGLYAAISMVTSIGPYLYTRFFIPDMLVVLCMVLSVHLFLVALDRVAGQRSPFLPSLGFGIVLALDLMSKGLIGVVFPVGFVLIYLLVTRSLKLLLKLQLPIAVLAFLAVAAPWHILAALRNPPIPMPAGLGLPSHAGWAWFYLYNEHIARFLSRRIPHDYGQVPIPLFWLLLFLWLVPWAAFLPSAIGNIVRVLRRKDDLLRFDSDIHAGMGSSANWEMTARAREAAITILVWAGLILGFFTISARQEYYHLPALPALALAVGGLLAAADRQLRTAGSANAIAERKPGQALRGSLYVLVPLGSLLFLVCGYLAITSPSPQPGVDLNSALSSNPDLYNLSLGHMFDLTGRAMGYFRGPLIAVSLCMLVLGPGSHLLRRRGQSFAANLLVAVAMSGVLLAAHEGLVRFYPILGSKPLAQTINQVKQPGDIIAIDGELTAGSTLLFYCDQQVLLVNGRINGPWFGSFWPDAPHIFEDEAGLHKLWAGPQRVFLLTYDPKHRSADLAPYGTVVDLSNAGGKTILINRR